MRFIFHQIFKIKEFYLSKTSWLRLNNKIHPHCCFILHYYLVAHLHSCLGGWTSLKQFFLHNEQRKTMLKFIMEPPTANLTIHQLHTRIKRLEHQLEQELIHTFNLLQYSSENSNSLVQKMRHLQRMRIRMQKKIKIIVC